MHQTRSVFRWAVSVASICLACHCKGNANFVTEVQASGVVSTSGGVVLPLEEVERLFLQRIRENGGFALAVDGARPSSQGLSVKLNLWSEVGWADDGKNEEIRLLIEIRPQSDTEARFEIAVDGVLNAKLDRTEAITSALDVALKSAARRVQFLCNAWKKQDVQLYRDLNSQEEVVRESAVDVLAYRGNPAVAEALMARLSSSNLVMVRRAIGGLVTLRETRAVPALISLCRGKDLTLIREIIFALSLIGGDEARAYLFTVSVGHDVPAIRSAAQKALEEMEEHPQLHKSLKNKVHP